MTGPDLWKSILSRCPSGSVVAGGAVRDYLLGVEPKDIDVFCTQDAASAEINEIDDVSDDGRPSKVWGPHPEAEEYEGMETDVSCVVQRTIDGVKVDLVIIDHPKEGFVEHLIDSFDFGLAQAWFDGADIHERPAATTDRVNRTVTCLMDNRPARAWSRFDRFNARNGGDWTPTNFPERPTPDTIF